MTPTIELPTRCGRAARPGRPGLALALVLLAACGSSKPATPASVPPPTQDGWSETPPTADPSSGPIAAPPSATREPMAEAFVEAHNRVRARHCAAPLVWSPALAKVAQSWATELANQGCAFGHSPGAKYGENLAAGTIGALDPESTVAMWYDEIKLYRFAGGGFSMQTGHFTQLVWTTTTQVGCGHVQCKGNDIYVCNYDPPGNWDGQYREHVLPASCKK